MCFLKTNNGNHLEEWLILSINTFKAFGFFKCFLSDPESNLVVYFDTWLAVI